MTYIPYLSTIVTFAFVAAVYNRYRQRGGMHLLLWAFGLFLYGLGTLSESILSLTFNVLVLKIWYLTGAMLTAAWLGMGSVHLLIRKARIGRAQLNVRDDAIIIPLPRLDHHKRPLPNLLRGNGQPHPKIFLQPATDDVTDLMSVFHCFAPYP